MRTPHQRPWILLLAALCLAAIVACGRSAPGEPRTIEIRVTNAGYQPARFETRAGETVRLAFHRETDSECLSEVQSKDLGIPLTPLRKGRITTVEIKTPRAGEYSFACGMAMFRATVVVKN
jgi:plastocyanin domain-containing protein